MSTENEEKIEIKEEPDGSVVVDLPENIPAPDDVPESLAVDEDADSDGDSEALRNAKRERRRAKRELARKTSAEKDQRLQLLQRQNEELLQRLQVVERKTHAGEIAKIDRTIEDYQLRVEYAKRKLGEATAAGDSDAAVQAQEMWYESRQQLEALQNLKKASSQPKQNNLPDPQVQKMAANWIKRNEWYDPNHRDTDSKIAKQIDEELTQQGWNPASEDYWDELDERLHRYLPHRYNGNHDGGSVRSSRPRNMQASAGRETSSGGRNAFVLTPDQVRAMKDAGFWDDPQKRNRMIKRYAEEARKSQGYRS